MAELSLHAPDQYPGKYPLGSTIPSSLRLLLDSAHIHQWERWLSVGLFYGVTTNPLLLEQAQCACQIYTLKLLAEQAFQLGAQEVQLQAWGSTVARYIQTGQALGEIDSRVVVKIPVTQAGTTAAVTLIRQGIRVTLTGVYAIPQVMIAAAIGAEYAAPYLGRIHDSGRNGCEDLAAMQRSLDGIDSPTRLLVASIRRVEDIATLAAHRLNTFTIAPAIAEALFNSPATLQAAEDFEQAAQRSQG
jgi:transaldolase